MCSEGSILFFFLGHFSHCRTAVFLLFSGILAIFGGRYFNYFRPFCPFSEGGTFVIFSHFGRFRRAVFLLFSAILAVLGQQCFHCGLQGPFFIGKYRYYVLPPLYSTGHMAMNADLVTLLPYLGILSVFLHMRKCMCRAAPILPMLSFIGSIFILPSAF